jgi:NitT/TauT family transport system substrate-binding protein
MAGAGFTFARGSRSRVFGWRCVLPLAASLLLAACGSSAAPSPAPSQAPAGSAPAASAPASAAPAAGASSKPAGSAKPAASAKASAVPTIEPAPAGTMLASYSELTPINLPLWIAIDEGIFKKNGLTVEGRYIESSLGVGALLSDEVKFAAMGGSEALAAAVNGADLKVLATLSPYYPYRLEVKDSIKTAADLKGKKLGISRFGSSSDSATRAALKKLGLEPTDVEFVQVGSLAARTAALLSGQLDGGVDGLPDWITLEQHGFHPLLDLAAAKLPAVNNTLVARAGWIQANKDTTQKYVDSIVEGIARAKADEPLSLRETKKYLKDRASDDQALRESYNLTIKEIMQIPPVTTPEMFHDALTQMAEKTAKAKGYDINKLIDNSFVNDAQRRGVGKSQP